MKAESNAPPDQGSDLPCNFLIVDDDRVSVLAVKRSLKKLGICASVKVARDGCEALEILAAERDGKAALPPYLVTLDLNMPRMNGFEFLQEVRKDPGLQDLSIFVLSTSEAPRDIAIAYDSNIAGYILKDNLHDSLAEGLGRLGFTCNHPEAKG